MSIGNWPPTYLDPVPEPPGLVARLADLERQLDLIRADLNRWYAETEQRRLKAWVAYYDTHGWPEREGAEYERRVRRAIV